MERLTTEDAAFLDLEDRISAMHSLTIGIFAGPEPDAAEIRERLEERIPLVPRFRQRVVEVPFDLKRPLWVDDPDFDLGYHFRHTGLPRDADHGDLRNLVGRLLSQRLDRGKPLWEIWMVSGLPNAQWALVSKAHHCMVDGVSGLDPLSLVVDQLRDRRTTPRPWNPDRVPTEAEMLGNAVADLAINPALQLRAAKKVLVDPIRRLSRMMAPAGPDREPSLVGAVGPHRRWSTAAVGFEEVRRARDRWGVATNDVIMGLAALGFRSMFDELDAETPTTIRALVPLAMATGDQFTNEVSALEADLPTSEPDLEAAVRFISAQTAGSRAGEKAVAGRTLASLRGLSAPTLSTLGLRSATRAGAKINDVQTVVVNAPGPDSTITMLDRPMESIYPAIPLVAKVRISVGVMSYAGRFHFGVSGDLDAVDEIDAIASGIQQAAKSL